MKLRNARKSIIISIIALATLVTTITIYLTFTQNKVQNQDSTQNQSANNASPKNSPQNSSVPVVNVWTETEKQSYSTPTDAEVEIPKEYLINRSLEFTSGYENTLIFDKKITNDVKESIQIDSEKNGARLTLEEKVIQENAKVADNTETIYRTYTENVKGNIAASTIYRTQRPSRLVIRTIINTPDVFHILYVTRDINLEADTLSTLTPELEKTKDALIQNYILSSPLAVPQTTNKDIATFRSNMIYYRSNLR